MRIWPRRKSGLDTIPRSTTGMNGTAASAWKTTATFTVPQAVIMGQGGVEDWSTTEEPCGDCACSGMPWCCMCCDMASACCGCSDADVGPQQSPPTHPKAAAYGAASARAAAAATRARGKRNAEIDLFIRLDYTTAQPDKEAPLSAGLLLNHDQELRRRPERPRIHDLQGRPPHPSLLVGRHGQLPDILSRDDPVAP